MKHNTYREMRKMRWGRNLIFFKRIDPSEYKFEPWDPPPDIVAVFQGVKGDAGLICCAKWGSWHINAGERFAIAELIKALSEGVGLMNLQRGLAGNVTAEHEDRVEVRIDAWLGKWERKQTNKQENG